MRTSALRVSTMVVWDLSAEAAGLKFNVKDLARQVVYALANQVSHICGAGRQTGREYCVKERERTVLNFSGYSPTFPYPAPRSTLQ